MSSFRNSNRFFIISLFGMMLLTVGVFAQQTAPSAAAEAKPAEAALITPDIIEHPEVKQIDAEGAGKLYSVGEHLVCVMEGTPEEMGFQHGRLLAQKIKHVITEGYFKKALWDRGYTPEYVNAQSARMEKFIPAAYMEEIKGIVKGLKKAGVMDVTQDAVRNGVTQAEILHFDPNSPPACSNFACWGQWTTDGRLLHGRNLDWSIDWSAQDDAVILVWRPKGGTPFMMVGWAGGIGSVSGMNAHGLTLGEMTCVSSDATFDGIPLCVLMRRVLQEAKNLDEAVNIIRTGPRTTGWNFILGDGNAGDGRALEVDAKACEVFGSMDPKENEETGHWSIPDAVRRTNHPISATQLLKLAQSMGPKMGLNITTMEQLKAAIFILKIQNTWQRYDWLGKQIQAKPHGMDVKEALQLLANGPVFNDDTLHSWVFDPKNKTAYVAVAGINPLLTATRCAFTKIDLSPWFN
ncbi:MAG TPA: C45 family autoproteolytic acyltransferase/hydrolase [Candidatus Hydrogenedentes bacterium]|nr:C45 family autoproteolytic acyltransferase/hydrolase [Candidatus Hydrogenedentota bacterium]